ncbi:HNH endonuclease family protein [Pseudonocardia sp.]|uniref:HNH endonuclease family protein n=1 Tax=Pseudonocardia sp. TaxID=60912 RepID=UPI00261A0CF6|nr:HNH endonuclease family protein [Pseudonocardia sp.]
MRRPLLVTILAAVLLLCGCTAIDVPALDLPDLGEITVGPVPTPTGDAAAALATLPVKGRAPKTGYERDRFGQRWADVDRDGCDQRNQVLARDLTAVEFRPGTRDCVVLSGALLDPYTGEGVPFLRGQDTSADVQIDHVVALSNAWQTGAQQLDADVRELLANDVLNLLAVDGPTNGSKGDGDAATWLPPARGYRCAYVARQVAVKAKYGLWVTAAESEAIARVLRACPGEPLPASTVPSGLTG